MAKENFVFLHGQVFDRPRVFVDAEGVAKKASFAVKVLRRPTSKGEGYVTTGKLSLDVPVIMTMDESLIRVCSTLRKGDMVDIRGVYTTREVKKKSVCKNGHENVWAGNFVFVTPIYISRRETELSDEDGMKLLRERAEVSNLVMMIGTLCREPELREFENNGRKSSVCQYQLASNRRYHIRDGMHEHERTDYPWIKTAGRQALEDMQRLHTGSVVFINGAIQTREIERFITCPECGESHVIKESVCEVFPYAVEYLVNCEFPAQEGDTGDNTGNQNGNTPAEIVVKTSAGEV